MMPDRGLSRCLPMSTDDITRHALCILGTQGKLDACRFLVNARAWLNGVWSAGLCSDSAGMVYLVAIETTLACINSAHIEWRKLP